MLSFLAAVVGFFLFWLSGFDQSERGLIKTYVRIVSVLAFVAAVIFSASGPSRGGAGCFTDWDGRSNRQVCW